MYTNSSQECLNNAEKLLANAKTLLNEKSFGPAQSLSVTALEEIGKAILLELADLNYVGRDVIDEAMRRHPPKKLILKAIEKGIVLRDSFVREAGDPKIDLSELKNLQRQLNDAGEWEEKRQGGLYVQVNVVDGSIIKTPSRISESDAQEIVNTANSFLGIGKGLCKVFRDLKGRKQKISFADNLRVNLHDKTIQWDEI